MEECPICREDKELVTESCGHKFCNECITAWLARYNTCPMCRRIIGSNQPTHETEYVHPITVRIEDMPENIRPRTGLTKIQIIEEIINIYKETLEIDEDRIKNRLKCGIRNRFLEDYLTLIRNDRSKIRLELRGINYESILTEIGLF